MKTLFSIISPVLLCFGFLSYLHIHAVSADRERNAAIRKALLAQGIDADFTPQVRHLWEDAVRASIQKNAGSGKWSRSLPNGSSLPVIVEVSEPRAECTIVTGYHDLVSGDVVTAFQAYWFTFSEGDHLALMLDCETQKIWQRDYPLYRYPNGKWIEDKDPKHVLAMRQKMDALLSYHERGGFQFFASQ